MGLFTKSKTECKLCGRETSESNHMEAYGICSGCAMILDSKVKSLGSLSDLSQKANAESDPTRKISYYKIMLDMLYEYKVKYYDNEVDVIEQNVEELIDDIVDAISEAKI